MRKFRFDSTVITFVTQQQTVTIRPHGGTKEQQQEKPRQIGRNTQLMGDHKKKKKIIFETFRQTSEGFPAKIRIT